MKSSELFLEIGTEEIPAAFVTKAISDMKNLMVKSLTESHISFEKIRTFGTPRRLILVTDKIAIRQDDVTVETQGPAKRAAYDDEGKPTKALLGFARGQSISVEKIEVRSTAKGEYVFSVKETKGAETVDLLPNLLNKFISEIHFRKSMRWKDLDLSFVRPIHWIAAIFAEEVVPFEYGDVRSSNVSRGHRFLAPEEFELSSFDDYSNRCQSGKVIFDPSEREAIITEGILKEAENAGGILIKDYDLVKEVANLVEYPVVLRGHFDEEFLKLPREVVINAMREHQRYFSIEDEEGNLLPFFITVSNTKARDMDVVRRGNERVLRARLSDAAFYYYEDLKTPLNDMVKSLNKVVFQARLGTSFEKVERFRKLAEQFSEELAPDLKQKVSRAAYISKGDLVSGVVGEFPSLQGVMGRDYALKQGEEADVAEAIFEHYLPKNADDILPKSDLGAIVSMADKMDTICGCIGVGLTPTGTSDPYALRRQTIGILGIIIEKKYSFSLVKSIDKAMEILQDKLTKSAEETKDAVLDYFKTRLMGVLSSKGYSHDVADAVLSIRFDNILDSVEVVKALSFLKESADFESLATSFKRVVNITKDFQGKTVDETLFEKKSENSLNSTCKSISVDIFYLAEKGKYKEALLKAAEIRPFVDSFFDDVMVMVEDVKIRENRLSLLKNVSALFTRFADFSLIAVDGNSS